MDVHVDINEKPGQSPEKRLFRRRIVFELDAEQLPALEVAERRHGTKRAALIAALAAEASGAQLAERAEQAEKALAKAERTSKGSSAKQDKTAKKLERELAATRKKLAGREQELAQLHAGAGETEEELRSELERLQEVVEELEADTVELSERAVDWIFCNRCEKWVAPDEWSWKRIKGGGSYAHHRSCGDHQQGFMASTSWLAQRSVKTK